MWEYKVTSSLQTGMVKFWIVPVYFCQKSAGDLTRVGTSRAQTILPAVSHGYCLQIIPIYVEKEIDAHDDLADLIAGSCDIRDADILVVAQKIISKQEGRTVDLRTVRPSEDRKSVV